LPRWQAPSTTIGFSAEHSTDLERRCPVGTNDLQELASRITAPMRTTAGRAFLEIVPPTIDLLAGEATILPAEDAFQLGRLIAEGLLNISRLAEPADSERDGTG